MTELNCVISPGAKLPVRPHEADAGVELYAYILENSKPGKLFILPDEIVTISTGVLVKLSQGYAGLLLNTNNNAQLGLYLVNGVGLISSNFRENITVTFKNISKNTHVIYWGHTLARLVVQTAFLPKIIEAKQ